MEWSLIEVPAVTVRGYEYIPLHSEMGSPDLIELRRTNHDSEGVFLEQP